MKIISAFIAILILLVGNTSFGQGFKAPAEGNAVIYFVRTSAIGSKIGFQFFDNDKYIGAFKGKNYMRYECSAGKNLFWASSENKEFLPVEVEAGKTYLVLVEVMMGAWVARVGLKPILISNTKEFAKAKEMINKKAPITNDPKRIEQVNQDLKTFIQEKLKMYNDVWKKDHNFNHITPNMDIPIEQLK